MKTTYPIIFGIWYGIWCTALHLLQSIDIFMDNAPAGAGRGGGGGGGGCGGWRRCYRTGCLTPPSLSAPRSGEGTANMPKQRKFLNKKQGYRCIISMWKYILKYEYIDRGYSLFYCEAQARFRQGSARKGWPLR